MGHTSGPPSSAVRALLGLAPRGADGVDTAGAASNGVGTWERPSSLLYGRVTVLYGRHIRKGLSAVALARPGHVLYVATPKSVNQSIAGFGVEVCSGRRAATLRSAMFPPEVVWAAVQGRLDEPVTPANRPPALRRPSKHSDLTGKVAVVIGGSRGLGREVVLVFAQAAPARSSPVEGWRCARARRET